jgi:threonine synthase
VKLYNLKHQEEVVAFTEALTKGMGRDRGLFFPMQIPALENVESFLEMPFLARSKRIIGAWLADELGQTVVDRLVENAFNFPVKVRRVDSARSVLELFHGPTLAFKDFGARFMAQCLNELAVDEKITILTATSGDTGAAVAHAFYGLENIRVVILYPEGKISSLQEKLFCTLGENIHTIAISSDFDACQELVKKAFVDEDIQSSMRLNSANSINISRLLAQICYYFEAAAVVRTDELVVAVPCGNFGNLTAGLLAKAMGLPIKRFIAATNANDTVPRYLKSGCWQPNPTIATSSNAMDVSEPSNWPRVEVVLKAMGTGLNGLESVSVSEDETKESLKSLYREGYLSEPHGSVAACALKKSLQGNEQGVFLATAHPAKFKETVEQVLNEKVALPPELEKVKNQKNLSDRMTADFSLLKEYLLAER